MDRRTHGDPHLRRPAVRRGAGRAPAGRGAERGPDAGAAARGHGRGVRHRGLRRGPGRPRVRRADRRPSAARPGAAARLAAVAAPPSCPVRPASGAPRRRRRADGGGRRHPAAPPRPAAGLPRPAVEPARQRGPAERGGGRMDAAARPRTGPSGDRTRRRSAGPDAARHASAVPRHADRHQRHRTRPAPPPADGLPGGHRAQPVRRLRARAGPRRDRSRVHGPPAVGGRPAARADAAAVPAHGVHADGRVLRAAGPHRLPGPVRRRARLRPVPVPPGAARAASRRPYGGGGGRPERPAAPARAPGGPRVQRRPRRGHGRVSRVHGRRDPAPRHRPAGPRRTGLAPGNTPAGYADSAAVLVTLGGVNVLWVVTKWRDHRSRRRAEAVARHGT